MRRRQRRLCSWWRHEQQSIAAALATYQHHSAQRQKTARAGEWGREMNFTATIRDRSFSSTCRSTNPAPQVRVLRHTVEHRIEAHPFVQILEAPVPQGENQLVDSFRHLDLPIPKQVIEVPKISSSSRLSRRVLRAPQTAEQLVDLPTVVFFSSLQQRTAEQTTDIPVQRRRRGVAEVFKVYALDRCTASSSHSPDAADEAFTWVFALSPKMKKSAKISRAQVRTGCGLHSMDAGSSSGSCGPGAGYVEGRIGVCVGPDGFWPVVQAGQSSSALG